MVKDDLRSLAEQIHSGKEIQQIDFGEANLNLLDKLKQMSAAIGKYPTPASVWDGSNEVVITIEEKVAAPAKKVQLLKIPKAKPIPTQTLPSKTRLKLTAADRARKVQLLDDLFDAETNLHKAHEAFRAGSIEWEEVEQLDRDYRQVIDEANTFIYTVQTDQRDYFADRSKKWQESEKGQAYQQWMDEWDVEISSDELPEPTQVGDLELTALNMLQELRDEPSV